MKKRFPAVAGSFYPSDPNELKAEIDSYLDEARKIDIIPKAIIAPHAGIIYSGPVAASAYVALREDQVIACLEEVLQGINGLKGLHCCGNTDWGLLLNLPIDIVSFDAYNYAIPLSLYSDSLKPFLHRGGIIAWGIVPNTAESLARESTTSLVDRLLAAMGLLVDKGIPLDEIVERSLITPSCGLGTLSAEIATAVCAQTAAVSQHIQTRYRG